jgi:Protein of unknown function (DUF4058)
MARDLSKSPFPGMDPYLEGNWGDVHQGLCTYSRDLLRKYLPAGLIARLEERTIIQDDIRKDRSIFPDVRVSDYRDRAGGVATAPPGKGAPIVLDIPDEPITEGLVKVLDTTNDSRVVTVIEFASPANKISTLGRQMYSQKQQELLYGGVSLVEVDLLRAGRSNLRAPLAMIEPDKRGVYHVSVTRGWQPSRCEVYPVKLQERLPVIEVPLRDTDNDAPLDLQILLAQIYENGSYGYVVDYSKPPTPVLSESDSLWAAQWLADNL